MAGASGEPGLTRRRGAELEATLLQAAWDEAAAVGYSHLTIEGVAARARTGKQVIYRRWANRARLMIAAMRYVLGPLVVTVPDTGSLRGDVLVLTHAMGERIRRVDPELAHGLIAEVGDLEPDFFNRAFELMSTVLEHAVERGELRGMPTSRRVVTLPLDLMRYEGMLANARLGQVALESVDAMITEIVDGVFLPLVLAVAGPPSSSGPPSSGPPSSGPPSLG